MSQYTFATSSLGMNITARSEMAAKTHINREAICDLMYVIILSTKLCESYRGDFFSVSVNICINTTQKKEVWMRGPEVNLPPGY